MSKLHKESLFNKTLVNNYQDKIVHLRIILEDNLYMHPHQQKYKYYILKSKVHIHEFDRFKRSYLCKRLNINLIASNTPNYSFNILLGYQYIQHS